MLLFFEQKAEQFKASDVPEIQQLSKAHLRPLQNKKKQLYFEMARDSWGIQST